MAENNFELPPTPPTSGSGPVIDPSSTAVPAVPRPTAPAQPSTTSSPWYPDFETPTASAAAAAASSAAGATPGRARRGANRRTRAIVGGTSVAAFLAILAAVGIHDRGQPASAVSTGDNGSATSLDPGFVQPNLGGGTFGGRFGGLGSSQDPYGSSAGDPFGSQSGSGSASDSPFSGGFSGGGFSATPGGAGGAAHTRSHGS